MEEAGWVVDVTLHIMGMQSTRLRSPFLVDPVGKLILRKQVRWSSAAPPAWGTLRAVSRSQTLTEVAMLHVNHQLPVMPIVVVVLHTTKYFNSKQVF